MGRYQLLFRIASGGMAEVYAARVRGEAGFQKLVALKRMLPTLADDEEFVTMFLDEARVAANISSPNVVQTLDLGRDDEGALYIVMELVVGVTLSRVVKEARKRRGVIPAATAVEILAQSAIGLHAAHDAVTPVGTPLHIVHRDVSPQNILVGVDGRARLTDFGVARAVMRMTKTDAGRIKGKFAYCSPEQLKFGEIDRRSDVFSLGIVAWETFTGQRLFVADHPLATMERVNSMPIPMVHQVRRKVPQQVSEVVAWALERDVDKRPKSALEFAEGLRNAARESGLELPMQSQVGRFVLAAGGEHLGKMRENIRRSLSNAEAAEALGGSDLEVKTPTSTSGIISEVSGTMDTEIGAGLIGSDDSRPESMGSLMVVPDAASSKKKNSGKSTLMWLTILLALFGGGMGIMYFAYGRPPTPPVTPEVPKQPDLPIAAPAPIPEPMELADPLVEEDVVEKPKLGGRSGRKRPRRGRSRGNAKSAVTAPVANAAQSSNKGAQTPTENKNTAAKTPAPKPTAVAEPKTEPKPQPKPVAKTEPKNEPKAAPEKPKKKESRWRRSDQLVGLDAFDKASE